MGLPVEINPLFVSSTGGYQVGRSLRFRSSATAYLNRTPSVAGNRRTWTWSGWVKRGALSSAQWIFDAFQDANNFTAFYFNSNDTFGIQYVLAATSKVLKYSTQVFRDPSAWYHIIVAVDTTPATPTFTLYVNGVQVTAFGTNTNTVSQNEQLFVNNTIAHNTARYGGAANYFDGYLAEVNFIDGQALTPSSFGAYDTNGVWQPKKYTGTYGTNGFYLPFTSGYNTSQAYAGGFNGSNQSLTLAANAAFAPGTGDFTYEANVNFSATPSSGLFVGFIENQISTTVASSDKFWFGVYNNAGTLQLRLNQHNTANWAGLNWTPTVGTWYHLAVVRQSGTTLIFINGVQQTVTNSTVFNGTSFSQNGLSVGSASNTGAATYFNGYISNSRYVVGSAVYTASFTPPSSNLTNITNTQLLTLQNATIVDNSTAARTITNNNSVATTLQYPFQYTAASISADYSGNGNNWTPNNVNTSILGTTYDSMIDSPTVGAGASNYAVFNYLKRTDSAVSGTAELSNGNLNLTNSTTNGEFCPATIGVTSGKWYWEYTITGVPSTGVLHLGICTSDYSSAALRAYRHDNGQYFDGSSWTAYGASFTTNDVIGVALDLDGQTITFYKNNVSQGQKTSIGVSSYVEFPYVYSNYSSGGVAINFGQRPFSYTPPTGYSALNTYNLPAATIKNGAQYMAATLWTGTGASLTVNNSQDNSGNNPLGKTFYPDLTWTKARSTANGNFVSDSVRGVNKVLLTETTIAEASGSQYLTAFNSNGFTVGTDAGMNPSGSTEVAWQWLAGAGATSSNTSGSITSTVSVSASSGFSIVSYTGTGAVATVGHSLGVAPNLIIWKNRSAVQNWVVYHSSLGATGNVYLNLTNAFSLDSTTLNNTAPTSSVFTVATSGAVNASTNSIIAYCWSAVRGYSAFGSYTGNGASDGPFIYCGFRPRFVLIKASSIAANWFICDTSRSPYNVAQNRLFPSVANAEATSPIEYDILSNGFKIRVDGVTDGGTNQNGATYVYAAFAENPFNSSRAR